MNKPLRIYKLISSYPLRTYKAIYDMELTNVLHKDKQVFKEIVSATSEYLGRALDIVEKD